MMSSNTFEIDLNCPSTWEDTILECGVVVRPRRLTAAYPTKGGGCWAFGHIAHQVGPLTTGLVGAQH